MNNLAIGLDIGGTRSKYGLVNTTTGEVLQTILHTTEKKNESIFIQQIFGAINQFIKIATDSNKKVSGIGIGVSSFVHSNGIIDSSYGFLEFMEDYPLKARLEKEFNLPVAVDNDARAVALGEVLYGKGKDFNRILSLTLGTGLGFGFVVNGKFPDTQPLSHMGGHMVITDSEEQCYCGKKGCLESMVSSFGVATAARRLNWSGDESAELIFKAATDGDQTARKIVNQIVHYLHIGIHNYINLFAPDIIILGGGISKGLLPYASQLILADYQKPYKKYSTKIEFSTLDEKAGIVGSAALTQLNHHADKK